MARRTRATTCWVLVLFAFMALIVVFCLSVSVSTSARAETYSKANWTDGKWPFVVRSVDVECESGSFPLLEAQGEKYALNGMTKTRFGYAFPYEGGIVRELDLPGLRKTRPGQKFWMSVDKFRVLAMQLCR